jgi:23S rRNA (uridine2552-2'-O)-methyltransferase
MARSKSSGNWINEHESDLYVKRSREDGYRSRASYKLLELNQKDKLIRPGMNVVDLGAAPGGWSQVAAELVGHNGRVVASDILPMDSLAGVEFVQGDFTEQVVLEKILAAVGNEPVDLVISDMAPNMSGMRAVDQPAAMYLVELALDMATQVLKPGGAFAVKVFQGEGFIPWLDEVRRNFTSCVSRKPDSSRSRSREVFVVAKGYKG